MYMLGVYERYHEQHVVVAVHTLPAHPAPDPLPVIFICLPLSPLCCLA